MRRFKPSPAMVVALLALVFAMAGTGLAAKNYVVSSSKQIKDGAVTGADVKNSSLTGTDIKDKSLKAADFDGVVQGPQGVQGPSGIQGPKGDTGPAGPITGVLPSGVTLRGIYAYDEAGTFVDPDTIEVAINFGLELPSLPTVHVLSPLKPYPEECSGSVVQPEAAPGHLCVYQGRIFGIYEDETSAAFTARYGVFLGLSLQPIAEHHTSGSWAVTAP